MTGEVINQVGCPLWEGIGWCWRKGTSIAIKVEHLSVDSNGKILLVRAISLDIIVFPINQLNIVKGQGCWFFLFRRICLSLLICCCCHVGGISSLDTGSICRWTSGLVSRLIIISLTVIRLILIGIGRILLGLILIVTLIRTCLILISIGWLVSRVSICSVRIRIIGSSLILTSIYSYCCLGRRIISYLILCGNSTSTNEAY